jgi:hypothetical protein
VGEEETMRRAAPLFCLALVCGCGDPDPGAARFESLTFARRHGLGFCPRTGSLFSASVSRIEGGFWFEADLLQSYHPQTCAEGVNVSDASCLSTKQLASRLLSVDELDQLELLLGNMSYVRSSTFPCAVDPCLINVLTIDERELSDDPCAERPLSARSVTELETLLDLLGSTAPTGSPVE